MHNHHECFEYHASGLPYGYSFRYIRGARLQLRSQRTLRSLRTVMVRTRSGFGITRLQYSFHRTLSPYSFTYTSFWSFYFNHTFLKNCFDLQSYHSFIHISFWSFYSKHTFLKNFFCRIYHSFIYVSFWSNFYFNHTFLYNCFYLLSHHSFIHISFWSFYLIHTFLKETASVV